MTAQLPMHLIQLEPLPGALDIIRYLARHPEGAASADDICDDLELSERRWGKALRRLITNNYIEQRPDGRYELARRGITSAQELAEYDANATDDGDAGAGKIARDVVIALPRQLVAGKSSEVLVGFAPVSSDFSSPADVVLRYEAVHGTLSTRDSMVKLGAASHRESITLTPQQYDTVRLKVKVFQLAEDGEDLTDCGGIYIDVDVVEENPNSMLVAYSANIRFNR